MIPTDSPLQVRIQESLNVAVEHAVEVANAVSRSGILYTLVRVEEVVSDLRSEADTGLALVFGRLLGFALLLLDANQP